MIRSWTNISLIAVFSLALGVIWPDFSIAVQPPQIELLGEIKAGLRVPSRIDVDNNGNIFVADSRLQKVFKFDKLGREVLVADQEKISGAGLAVSPAGDRIYASAFDKVVVYDGAGALLGYLGRGAGEFVAAGSIDLDSDGNIYIVDLNRRQVKIFHPDGYLSGQLGADFVANSSLACQPTTDQLYLTDSFVSNVFGAQRQRKVTVYDRSGTLLKSILAKNGFGSAEVRFFGGMTFDAQNRFYVSDIEDMTIRVLDPAGTPLLSYTRDGMSHPVSMAYDAVTSRLFVVQADQKIDIYGIDGGQNPVENNHAPSVPVPVAPIGGSEVVSQNPSLQFNNSVDADEQDTLSYNIRVFDAAQNPIASFSVAEQTVVTSVLLTVNLQENGLYRWQVQAFDGEAESDWSELQSFYVNASQEAPSSPVLTAPLAGAAVQTDALLEWQAATDSDPFDSLNYLLEVSAASDFKEILFSEELTATQRALADWSVLIEPGQNYFWRVTAIDNHGLKAVSDADGQFLYQASMLNVTANMPGARAYLGGHQGYAGQFIGDLPVSLRDLPEGRYQLVVERAGFEAFLQPVEVRVDLISEVYAELRPAPLPDMHMFKPLNVGGREVAAGSQVAALIADLDLDGVEDLLLTHADGSIHLHPGTLNNENEHGKFAARNVSFQDEQLMLFPQLASGTPCLIDWNNDYLQDLLIGSADGAVALYLNQGEFVFSETPIWLASVGSSAVPAVADIDADGRKDLVVGSGDGELVLFRNLGTDSEPQLAEPQTLTILSEAVAPSFADWNGDGRRELLIAAEGQIYNAVYSAGALTGMSLIEVDGTPVARVIALDIDGVEGKDLIAGTADGRLLIANSGGTGNRLEYVADFYLALETKLQQLEEALGDEVPTYREQLDKMADKLAKKNIVSLGNLVEKLQAELVAESAAAAVANELMNILK